MDSVELGLGDGGLVLLHRGLLALNQDSAVFGVDQWLVPDGAEESSDSQAQGSMAARVN